MIGLPSESETVHMQGKIPKIEYVTNISVKSQAFCSRSVLLDSGALGIGYGQ